MTITLYDTKCAELAIVFLEDEMLVTDENIRKVATAIQNAIEDTLEDIKDRGLREPKRGGA